VLWPGEYIYICMYVSTGNTKGYHQRLPPFEDGNKKRIQPCSTDMLANDQRHDGVAPSGYGNSSRAESCYNPIPPSRLAASLPQVSLQGTSLHPSLLRREDDPPVSAYVSLGYHRKKALGDPTDLSLSKQRWDTVYPRFYESLTEPYARYNVWRLFSL